MRSTGSTFRLKLRGSCWYCREPRGERVNDVPPSMAAEHPMGRVVGAPRAGVVLTAAQGHRGIVAPCLAARVVMSLRSSSVHAHPPRGTSRRQVGFGLHARLRHLVLGRSVRPVRTGGTV